MTSKLDYLKKYLAKPGDATTSASGISALSDKKVKKDKKLRLGGKDSASFKIRDLSEALPEAKVQRKRGLLAEIANEIGMPDDLNIEYVDAHAVEAAQNVEVEKSGVAWKISQHRKSTASKPALRGASGVVKMEVKTEDADLSPPRRTTATVREMGRDADSDISPPRLAPKREDDSDMSPPRRTSGVKEEADSDADLSPPRAQLPKAPKGPVKEEENSDEDLSPPRASAKKGQQAGKGRGSDSDLSPPRNATAAVGKVNHDQEFTIKFKPGELGLGIPADDGVVANVVEGKQADVLGIKKGMRLTKIGGASFTRRALHAAATGKDVYTVTCERHAQGTSKQRHDSDSDISPPRQAAGGRALKQRHDSDADLSPPRKNSAAATAKQRHDSDADLSPPRKNAAAATAKQRHDSDADLSPPRKNAAAGTAKQRHDSDADLSPPRKASGTGKSSVRQRHDSDADLSPPRRGGTTATGKKTHDSDADLSPPRKAAKAGNRHDSDADLSPPRKEASAAAKKDDEPRMTSGLRSGLVKGGELKADAAEVREKRKAELEAQADTETGKNAETVYRSRGGGTQISREQWAEEQTKKKKKRLSEYPEQELEWGGGVKQKYNKEAEMEELSRIAAQPFARYEPDSKYMEELKEKQDWNDPMKKHMDDEAEKVKGSGTEAQAEAERRKQRPKCPHKPWLNRFNILPGYRWDGKIRGNDFEKRWLENLNHKEFKKKEAWMYDELNA